MRLVAVGNPGNYIRVLSFEHTRSKGGKVSILRRQFPGISL